MTALVLKVLLANALAMVAVESVKAMSMSMAEAEAESLSMAKAEAESLSLAEAESLSMAEAESLSMAEAESPFEMRDEGHTRRKHALATAAQVRAAMAKRLRSRRHRSQSHPRSVKALRKSLRLSKHAEGPNYHEILPFSKIWRQHHRNRNHSMPHKHLHGDKGNVLLLAIRAKMMHGSLHKHSQKQHRSLNLITERMKSKFTKVAQEAGKHAVHMKVGDNEVEKFETGQFKEEQNREHQAWSKSRLRVLLKLKRRQVAAEMRKNHTLGKKHNHSLGKNHTNHTKSII